MRRPIAGRQKTRNSLQNETLNAKSIESDEENQSQKTCQRLIKDAIFYSSFIDSICKYNNYSKTGSVLGTNLEQYVQGQG